MKDDEVIVILEELISKFDEFYEKLSRMYKMIHEIRLSLDELNIKFGG